MCPKPGKLRPREGGGERETVPSMDRKRSSNMAISAEAGKGEGEREN